MQKIIDQFKTRCVLRIFYHNFFYKNSIYMTAIRLRTKTT